MYGVGRASHHLLWLKFWLPSALFWAQTPSSFSNMCPSLEISSFSGARWDRGWIGHWGSSIHDWGWGYACALVPIPCCPAVGGSRIFPSPAAPASSQLMLLSVQGTCFSPLAFWLLAASPVLRAEKRHTFVPARHRCACATHTVAHLLESWRKAALGWDPQERQSVA